MSDLLKILRQVLNRPDPQVPVSRVALEKYIACVDEWNENYFDDEWCDSSRGVECKSYIDWFAEVYR